MLQGEGESPWLGQLMTRAWLSALLLAARVLFSVGETGRLDLMTLTESFCIEPDDSNMPGGSFS